MEPTEKCTEPELGRLVFRWGLSAPWAETRPQDARLAAHIEACPYCKPMAPIWKKKGEAGRISVEANRIIAGNLRPEERLDQKVIEGGRALFKYSVGDPRTGWLIILNTEGRASDVRPNVSRTEFEALQAR